MPYHAIILTDVTNSTRVKPLGAFSIANALRDKGYTVLVIDYFSKIPKSDLLFLLDKFISDETLFLGYSSSLFLDIQSGNFLPRGYTEITEINNYAKTKNSALKIVFGGANSKNLFNHNCRTNNNLGFDYVMHGYSDNMIVEFIDNIKNKRMQRFSNVYNKLYEIDYDHKGECFNFRDSIHKWHDSDFISQGESLPLEVARGCIFRCKFCAYPLLGKNPNDNSYIKKEENLYLEIKDNYERFNVLNYVITDDTFNERTDKIQLLLRIRDRLKLDLNFSGYTRLDLIARKFEQLKLLKDLNFNGHFFGIESLNYESAKSIGKGLRPEECIETLHKVRDAYRGDVSITAGFIIGLPYETPATFTKWSELIIQDDFPIDHFLFNPLILSLSTHTKSEFSKNPLQYGYEAVGTSGHWKNSIWDTATCKMIAQQLTQQLNKTGRQKVSAVPAAGLASLGYNFSELIKTSKRDLDSDEISKKLADKVSEYIANLKSL